MLDLVDEQQKHFGQKCMQLAFEKSKEKSHQLHHVSDMSHKPGCLEWSSSLLGNCQVKRTPMPGNRGAKKSLPCIAQHSCLKPSLELQTLGAMEIELQSLNQMPIAKLMNILLFSLMTNRSDFSSESSKMISFPDFSSTLLGALSKTFQRIFSVKGFWAQ